MALGKRLLGCNLLLSLALALGIWPARAETPSGQPIRIGQTLSLTGPFAQTGLAHQIASQIFVERLNRDGGLLGRPVEFSPIAASSTDPLRIVLYDTGMA